MRAFVFVHMLPPTCSLFIFSCLAIVEESPDFVMVQTGRYVISHVNFWIFFAKIIIEPMEHNNKLRSFGTTCYGSITLALLDR